MYSGPQHGAPCLYQDDGTRPHLRLAFSVPRSAVLGGGGGVGDACIHINLFTDFN